MKWSEKPEIDELLQTILQFARVKYIFNRVEFDPEKDSTEVTWVIYSASRDKLEFSFRQLNDDGIRMESGYDGTYGERYITISPLEFKHEEFFTELNRLCSEFSEILRKERMRELKEELLGKMSVSEIAKGKLEGV